VIDETLDVKNSLQALLDSLPNCLTNKSIEETSHRYIDLLERYVRK